MKNILICIYFVSAAICFIDILNNFDALTKGRSRHVVLLTIILPIINTAIAYMVIYTIIYGWYYSVKTIYQTFIIREYCKIQRDINKAIASGKLK